MSVINTTVQPFKVDAFKNGKFIEVTEQSLKGKWSVFVFMPAAFTFNCPTEVEDACESGRCRHRPTCDFEECAPAGIFARRPSQAVAIPILHLCISVVWVTLSVSAPLSLPSVPAPPEGLLRQASRTLRPDSAPRFPGSHWARRRGTSPVLAHGEGRTPVTWMLSMNQ